jgi:UDP-N-acetylmuramoyl-L-alanyl-D-glutamate--2,6-diaminopimelate ligase
MRACELFEGLPLTRIPHGAENVEILRVVTSAKEATQDSLYVACQTAIANGRFEMEMAYARGCRAFLCSHDAYPGEGAAVWRSEAPERLLGALAAKVYGYPARQMTVLGITGSAGKSSVALQTVRVLRDLGRRVSALTSDGVDILGKRTYPGAVVPDAAAIQEALAQMVSAGSEIAVLELSSYQLLHHAAEEIPFTAVLLTNLSERHVGRGEHESFDAYRAAKHTLLQKPSAFCVIPMGETVQSEGRVIRVGAGGDVWAENVRTEHPLTLSPHTALTLCTKTQKTDITLPVIGDIAVHTALYTAVLCQIAGLSLQEVAQGLAKAPVSGRMECLSARNERLIYLDNAFLPQDLFVVLQALRPLAQGRLCVLLGSVGGRAKERRAELVRVAERFADRLYLTADDPDSEDPESICREMQSEMQEPLRACVICNRRAAILRAVREMRPRDVLLILAKSYPAGQLLCGRYLPFDEREIVAQAVSEC